MASPLLSERVVQLIDFIGWKDYNFTNFQPPNYPAPHSEKWMLPFSSPSSFS